MTIRQSVNIREANAALSLFDAAVENAPHGYMVAEKEVHNVIGVACDSLIQEMNAIGFKVNNCDGIREIEAMIYDLVKRSNPDHTLFAVAEGFGEAVQGPARERVLANVRRDMDFLDGVQNV